MLKILIITDTFDKGGLQKVILDQALQFKRLGHNISILTLYNEGFLSKQAEKKHIKVLKLFKQSYKEEFFTKLLLNNKYNIVCSHCSDFGYEIIYKLKIPIINFIHNVYAFFDQQKVLEFKEKDKYISKYIAVSKMAMDYVVLNWKIKKEKIIEIPNSLNIEEHSKRLLNSREIPRSTLNLKNTDKIFLNVASYNLHKGHYLMIEALKIILKNRSDIKILCPGNIIYPPHIDELFQYLKNSGLEKYIVFCGFYEDIESLFKLADAFILPSFIEGWSIAMNEAMFYQKPMILSNVGGAQEVIDDNDIGIMIPHEYGDPLKMNSDILNNLAYWTNKYKTSDILAQAMINMADNIDYWKETALKSREKVSLICNVDKIFEMYLSTFYKTINEYIF